ncbi:ribosome biogenesis regulatory protein homolog [Nomia melanderi]|uniref:ribosome biogenesis regulatory protein homolog n=1 Tax=Nomia melanderi TaxID=2448451 RepID=UPI0013040836|nr:ribosome biogenesis regulatory protein homolog [Nomia melanderi]XP_031826636.1 ribosome biogenesis regulatory protein homolog [Nomia melanderi]XP_031826637.1 ribosome biogenesis regulatory protein homolog [Nomia melanderi]XP_031826638.1 ribosome biogenesis regulatory protein homolog [Nomia melanderi]
MDIVQSILENETQEKDLRKSIEVNKDIEVEIDAGSLLAFDYNTLNIKALKSGQEKYLTSLTRDNVQILINKIWELPIERVEETIVAKLPKPEYVLPRSRQIPKPKPLTKWQQYAKEKGIKSKKKDKSKLKWDTELQKWIPTFGYKRSKAEEQKEWLVEINDDNKVIEDPFAAAKAAKGERQSKNELQRLRNIAKAKNIKIPQVGLPTKEHFPDSQQLSQAITVARTSTASVGKFQNRLPKEKDAKGIAKQVPGMKRKAEKAPENMQDEKRRNKDLAENILKNNTKVFREDFSVPKVQLAKPKAKKGKKGVKDRGAKKPKGGKGKRDMRLKVGGRKRR